MIAADEHYLKVWTFGYYSPEEFIQALLSGNRWVDRVVNVARDDECVSLLFDQLLG